MAKDSFNFRRASERERFYLQVIDDIDEVVEAVKDKTKRRELASALRVVLSIGAFSAAEVSKWSKDDPEQGAGKFRGFRSFRDLRLLNTFLNGSNYSGVFAKKQAGRYSTEARLVAFRRRGKRVTGETVYRTYSIIWR